VTFAVSPPPSTLVTMPSPNFTCVAVSPAAKAAVSAGVVATTTVRVRVLSQSSRALRNDAASLAREGREAPCPELCDHVADFLVGNPIAVAGPRAQLVEELALTITFGLAPWDDVRTAVADGPRQRVGSEGDGGVVVEVVGPGHYTRFAGFEVDDLQRRLAQQREERCVPTIRAHVDRTDDSGVVREGADAAVHAHDGKPAFDGCEAAVARPRHPTAGGVLPVQWGPGSSVSTYCNPSAAEVNNGTLSVT
jgi:hypothetical protein